MVYVYNATKHTAVLDSCTMRLDAAAGDFDFGDVDLWDNERLEGRAEDVLVVEGDVDAVLAQLGGQVGDGAGAVAVVAAVDGRLARPLHRHAEAALAGAARVDGEIGRPIHHAALQTGPVRLHLQPTHTPFKNIHPNSTRGRTLYAKMDLKLHR
jgi:hypothetical protein